MSDKIAAFFQGCAVGVGLGVLTLSLLLAPPSLHFESKLPSTCQEREKVIITTPTPVEFYVCETVWKRR